MKSLLYELKYPTIHIKCKHILSNFMNVKLFLKKKNKHNLQGVFPLVYIPFCIHGNQSIQIFYEANMDDGFLVTSYKLCLYTLTYSVHLRSFCL